MKYKGFLDKSESIVKIVKADSGLMFHSYDGFKILMALFMFVFVVLLCFIVGNIAPLILGFPILFLPVYQLSRRYALTCNMEYLVTDKRVFFIKKNLVKKTVNFNDLDEIVYKEKSLNKGYIILGGQREIFANINGDATGISFTDEKYILDNLSNFDEISYLIKRLHKEARIS
jgi:5-bromo-4-chloroindolyl phosphate hydrolysis protein